MSIILVLYCIFGYLAGSIPFGKILISRKLGIDIQKHGSGNIGFANVARIGGMKIGLIVLGLDILKGLLPVGLAKIFYSTDTAVLIIISWFAIIGHAFPIWLKFRGGKSIATGFGTLLILSPLLALIGLLSYLVVFLSSKKSAISSLAAVYILVPCSLITRNKQLILHILLFMIFASYTHRTNIKKRFRY